MWTGLYMPSAYGLNIIFIVLKSAQILIHNILENIEWIWPISGPNRAFQMYQILYRTLWANHTIPECTMIPPVAEFCFNNLEGWIWGQFEGINEPQILTQSQEGDNTGLNYACMLPFIWSKLVKYTPFYDNLKCLKMPTMKAVQVNYYSYLIIMS